MHCTGVRRLKSCVQARNANGRRTFDVHTCQWPTKLYGFFFFLLFQRYIIKENQDYFVISLLD